MTSYISIQTTNEPQPHGRFVIDSFEDAVDTYPDKAAIIDDDNHTTYALLNITANAIAHQLAALRAQPNSVFGIAIDHGTDRITASLGILKAGYGYVILDLGLRDSQLKQLLIHAQCAGVFVQEDSVNRLQTTNTEDCILLPFDSGGHANAFHHPNPTRQSDANSVAYIRYTSGSTGEPKGVAHTQRTAAFLAQTFADSIGSRAEDRVTLFNAFWHTLIHGTFVSGGTLCLYDLKKAGYRSLSAWIKHHRISVLSTFPTAFRRLTSTLQTDDCLESVRIVSLSGELLHAEVQDTMRGHFPETCSLVNNYGCSELAHIASYRFAANEQINTGPVPVGPVANGVEVSIRDPDNAGGPLVSKVGGPRGVPVVTGGARNIDTLEAEIRGAWIRALKLNQLGTDDDFFELGGNSMIAIELVSDIARRTGQVIPLNRVFELKTIRDQVAWLVRRAGDAPPREHAHQRLQSLMPIRVGGKRHPYFLLPPAGSTGMYFSEFARQVCDDIPLYSFDTLSTSNLASVEQVAAAHIDEIRYVYDQGSCVLIGACFGAHVAFEIAQQLGNTPLNVRLLAVIDASPPFGGPDWDRPDVGRLTLPERLRILAKPNGWEYLVAFMRKRLRKIGGITSKKLHAYHRAIQLQSRMIRKYKASKWQGRILLIQSNQFALDPMRERRWASLAVNGLVREVIDNTRHRSIASMNSPYWHHIAQTIERSVAACEQNAHLE